MMRAWTAAFWMTLSTACLPPAASAVAVDWTLVGAPANACDMQTQGCFGAAGSYYRIGT